jgi:hypothetical protein
MTSDAPRRIFVGVLPSGHDAVFVDGPDPARLMLRAAGARLDREHAEAETARLAQVADQERLANMRRARLARRFRRVLAAALPKRRRI